MNQTTTKSGMTLLTPLLTFTLVRLIERHCPGWTWSLSQKVFSVRLTVIPGPNSPFEGDKLLLNTREGDAGYIFDYVGDRGDFHSVENYVCKSLDGLTTKRGFSDRVDLVDQLFKHESNTTTNRTYRRQAQNDLRSLLETYTKAIEDLSIVENTGGYTIQEIYLGSCDLSVDCSIRGNRADSSDFDITVDLVEDATLADSLHWTIDELKSDILTPR